MLPDGQQNSFFISANRLELRARTEVLFNLLKKTDQRQTKR